MDQVGSSKCDQSNGIDCYNLCGVLGELYKNKNATTGKSTVWLSYRAFDA